jgi:hypothetical protein
MLQKFRTVKSKYGYRLERLLPHGRASNKETWEIIAADCIDPVVAKQKAMREAYKNRAIDDVIEEFIIN